MSGARPHAPRETGIALVTALILLTGLMVVALPFALSMRHMQATSELSRGRAASRAGAMVAIAAAARHLEDTHPAYDLETPHHDPRSELSPDDLAERFPDLLVSDARGDVRSVRAYDESGKVDLSTASAFLLGNLMGGRTRLSTAVGVDEAVLPVAGTDGFPDTGIAWIGRELVEYSAREADALAECRRGLPSANLVRGLTTPHAAGREVLDLRVLLLAQHGWRIRPGIFDLFRRVENLKDIGLYGEMTYTADEIARVRDDLTVHGASSRAARWIREQPLLAAGTSRVGGAELFIPDGSRYGAGTVVRVTDAEGVAEWNLVIEAVPWDGSWRLGLLEPLTGRHDEESTVAALRRVPVNVATCSRRVLVALLEGLGRTRVVDVITDAEAARLALELYALEGGVASDELVDALREPIREGAFSEDDVRAALADLDARRVRPSALDLETLTAQIAGLTTERARGRLSRRDAEALADRIRAADPGSHEALRAVLDAAVDDGVIDDDERDVVLRNAVDSADAALHGGTAPFVYASDGVFTVEAAVSHNLPSGREQSRAFVREVLSVAPRGETLRTFRTQRDFEAAMLPTEGWTSGPRLLASGPGRGRADAPVYDELPPEAVAMADVLSLGRAAPDRAATLLAGRDGPSDDEAASWVAPAPRRSTLPDVIHFDAGHPGTIGSSAAGRSFADGPVDLAVEDLVPRITDARGLLGPFAVEFWFELEDLEDEVVLFDGGADEVEDRVLILFADGELVLRVSDTGIPDFEAVLPEGRLPPAGEIRYAFDDGLPLAVDTPYHVAAWIGGARDTRLALFVDGVPRGRRSFTTRLTDDVEAGAGAGLGSGLRLSVEDTRGFPNEGVLRVGAEVMEYVQKLDDAFLVRATDAADPFGGRGKRGSFPEDHEAGTLVELLGYSRPLWSEQAALGNARLGSTLGPFALAQVDATALQAENITITFELNDLGAGGVQPQEIIVGTGLTALASQIPVSGIDGGALAPGTFQESGGYAVLWCDYGGLAGRTTTTLDGATTYWPPRTDSGAPFGFGEVVRYASFSGGVLGGVQRGALPPGSPLEGASQSEIADGDTAGATWDEAHEYVTEFSADAMDMFSSPPLPDFPRVLVIPISVGLAQSVALEDFHPAPNRDLGDRSPLLQVSLDFASGEPPINATEWIRWTTHDGALFVRDDLDAVERMIEVVDEVWNPDLVPQVDDDLAEAANDELDFRGQAGTVQGRHDASETVFPVHVLGADQIATFDPDSDPLGGVPGRNDAVTLVSPDGTKEWHRVNYATIQDEEWGTRWALVGLRDAVVGEFYRTFVDDPQIGDGSTGAERELARDGEARLQIERLNVEGRELTRMLKAPSGELPAVPIERFQLGRDWVGRRSPGVAVIDELRFHEPAQPGPLLPDTARYVLVEDLDFDEDRQLRLGVSTLQYSFAMQRNPVLGADALEVLSELPQDGGLLLVGEEIIGYAGLDPTDTGHVFIARRGMYGTAAVPHRAGEAVTALTFWPVSPLSGRLSEDGARLSLTDASDFPRAGGLVWVGSELVEYVGVDGDDLLLPHDPVRAGFADVGLLRGRFGTTPQAHPAGTLARFLPSRHRDRALPGRDGPWDEDLTIAVSAPGAVFTRVGWIAERPDPTVGLTVRAVTDARAARAADPDTSPQLVGFVDVPTDGGRLDLQGDRLELHFTAEWRPGAFDALGFASNGWKLAPRIDDVLVWHVQPSWVIEHEEWR